MSVSFATAQGLPLAPKGSRLARVVYESCKMTNGLSMRVVQDVDATLDVHGVSRDAWWVVSCDHLPDRTFRLFRGGHSLQQLLKRYGFLDADGCVNHLRARAEYAPAAQSLAPHALSVPQHLRDATGVPQFYHNSGACWYGTMCWISFANPKVRDLLLSHMPDDEMRDLASRSIFDRDAAQRLRSRLWYEYAIGDDVEQDPSLDGRNGLSEFSVLCAKLDMPMKRFREEGGKLHPLTREVSDRRGKRARLRDPKEGEPHLLVLRYQDGDHHGRHPIERRITLDGQRYRLLGMYLGQRKCGHQIGSCFPFDSWRDVAWGDSDLHKDGIGPIYVRFAGAAWKDNWWNGMRQITHLTKFGAEHKQICNMSPHNERDDLLDEYRGSRKSVGSLSIDVVYQSCAC